MRSITRLVAEHQDALLWFSGASFVMFAGSLLLVPFLIARAPRDLFVREPRAHRGAAAMVRKVARNVIGGVLLVIGLLMLVLPGQGLLMVLLALLLVDLPGKRTLVRRIVLRPAVWRALHFLRERAHQPPFDRPRDRRAG